MNTENNFAHFYTELSLNPDLPTLPSAANCSPKSCWIAIHSHKRSPYVVAWGLSGRGKIRPHRINA
jgi:hypothetical protein